MIEKNVASKYWKEAINTTIHTLNQVQLKKDSNQTPYKLWYGYKPNVYYFNIFGRKIYILKETRKGKFDAKSDEGIFLGYSNKIKAYKCLNIAAYKVIKNIHVKIDEFVEKSIEQSNKDPKDYKKISYFEPSTLPKV